MEMGPKNNVEDDPKADPELETLAVPRPRRSRFFGKNGSHMVPQASSIFHGIFHEITHPGWWFQPSPLKNHGLRQWEGLYNIIYIIYPIYGGT
jgi:hypothetical protein